jgi:uncharacterized protein with PIN domain
MPSASFRFYGPLNDFLPESRRHTTLVCEFRNKASVKDLIEALGVPHVEIDLLVVDGRLVEFSYRVSDGDRVAVYPVFQGLDPGDAVRLGPSPPGVSRFVADVHLGRLTAYLRLAGFDTKYRNDFSDAEIVALSAAEDRTLLTRDVGILKRRVVTRGYFLRETPPARQFVEVLRRFDLAARAAPFTRCLRCNGRLRAVPRQDVAHRLPAWTREHYSEFSECATCGRVYWRGSHHARMSLFLTLACAAAARSRSPG